MRKPVIEIEDAIQNHGYSRDFYVQEGQVERRPGILEESNPMIPGKAGKNLHANRHCCIR